MKILNGGVNAASRIERLRPIYDVVRNFDHRNERAQRRFEEEIRDSEQTAEEQIDALVRNGVFPFDVLLLEQSSDQNLIGDIALAVDMLPESDQAEIETDPMYEEPTTALISDTPESVPIDEVQSGPDMMATPLGTYICPTCDWQGVPNPNMRAKCPVCFKRACEESGARRKAARQESNQAAIEADLIPEQTPAPKFEVSVESAEICPDLIVVNGIPSIAFDDLTNRQKEQAVQCRAKGFASLEADEAKEFWLVLVPAGIDPIVVVPYIDVRLSLAAIADGELLIERCYRSGRTWWRKDSTVRSGEMMIGRKQD